MRVLPAAVAAVLVVAGAAGGAAAFAGHRGEPGTPPPMGASSTFSGVACASASSCIAVGSYQAAGGSRRVLVERWDGSGWAVGAAPSPGTDDVLNAVACSSPTLCIAVGSSGADDDPAGRRGIAERWDGGGWSLVDIPSTGRPSSLEGVECLSEDSCRLAGWSAATGVATPFVDGWDGRRWSRTAPPFPTAGANDGAFLESISCGGPGSCLAAGLLSTNDGGDGSATLADSLSGGGWTQLDPPSPAVLGGDMSGLRSVACWSPAHCVAVGAYARGNVFNTLDQALAERWDGEAWTVGSLPGVEQDRDSRLEGVACPSASACLAGGWAADATGAHHPLAEAWDGGRWSTARLTATAGEVHAVSCPRPGLCLLAGESPSGSASRPLAQWWRGEVVAVDPAAGVPLPPPSIDPSYPPRSLADLVALADRGLDRRLVGTENGEDQGCSLAWVKVHEVDGTSPEQVAADLLQMAIKRHVLTTQCGGFVYGTTDLAFCNCYLGDHGLLTITRGPLTQMPPGEMRVTFQVSDSGSSPGDWEVTLPEVSSR